MRSEQVDKTVLKIGENFKYVKYTYRYISDNEEKLTKQREKRTSDSFKQISTVKTPIKDVNGKYIGWIAEHLYQKVSD